jgi:hypothetical protein
MTDAEPASSDEKSTDFDNTCKRWLELECTIQKKNQEKRQLEQEKKQLQPVIQQYLASREEDRRKLQWSWSDVERERFGDIIGIEWYQGDSKRDMTRNALSYLLSVMPDLMAKNMQEFIMEYELEPEDRQRFLDSVRRASSNALQDAYANSPVTRKPTIRSVMSKKRKRNTESSSVAPTRAETKRLKMLYESDSDYS